VLNPLGLEDRLVAALTQRLRAAVSA
jgi:hypothetical protein